MTRTIDMDMVEQAADLVWCITGAVRVTVPTLGGFAKTTIQRSVVCTSMPELLAEVAYMTHHQARGLRIYTIPLMEAQRRGSPFELAPVR